MATATPARTASSITATKGSHTRRWHWQTLQGSQVSAVDGIVRDAYYKHVRSVFATLELRFVWNVAALLRRPSEESSASPFIEALTPVRLHSDPSATAAAHGYRKARWKVQQRSVINQARPALHENEGN